MARQEQMRDQNLAVTLRTIVDAATPLSRAQVAAQAGLARGTVTGLVDQQISNDPGGTRWERLIDDAVDMFFAFATAKADSRRNR